MINRLRVSACVAAAAIVLAATPRADAPHIYAIKGARIVTAAGAPIASGTVVIRNGLIEGVGADVQTPATAMVIEGAGLTVYPGLIDMGNTTGVDVPSPNPPEFRSMEEAERWKRTQIFHPDVMAAANLRADSLDLVRLATNGVTSVLATPPGQVFRGQSALVNVAGPIDEPQIGNVGDYRRGLQVVRTPVALHVDVPNGARGDGYPASLIGVISFIRQSFLDAQHQQLAGQRYERLKAIGVPRPNYDPSLDALQPALAGKMPVAFDANLAREIWRALEMAQAFKLDPVITGAREADMLVSDLKARSARVIYNLNFSTRSQMLPPDADEPVRELRARARAPKVPAALEKAGITFAFSSAGLREPRDFLRNAARAVKDGLSPDAAIRALTINAARIAGAADRIGSIEKGKIANVVVTEGDLFDEKMQVKHVFVDGRLLFLEPQQPERRGGRGGN